ncbi:MAG: ABC transporter permease [Caldilineaceae bacterium]
MSHTSNILSMKQAKSEIPTYRPRFQALRSLGRRKVALAGVIVILVMILVAIFAPYLTPYEPNEIDVVNRLNPPGWTSPEGDVHILGTDSLGRDVLTRLVYGARVSLLVGITAVLIAGSMGVFLGLVSGYFGGWLDAVIMRLADIQFAFPFILLAIAVLAVMGPGLGNLILILGLNGWVRYGRITRSQVLAFREEDFVLAAHSIGSGSRRIIFQHILPNTWGPIIVIASFMVASTIIAEAALSFLGLGVPPGIPSWGTMLADGRDYMERAPWLSIYAGLAISIVVLSINVVGDWIRDFLDPNMKNIM